jgi:cyclase
MVRIISRLDVKPPYVVKPIQFEGLRKIGLPNTLAQKYYLDGSDEIMYIDIVSSLYNRTLLIDEIKKCSENIYVPFAAGGGVKTLDDVILLLRNGVDKVIINTQALKNPEIIKQANSICGSQSITIHIEAKFINNHYECYSDCGRIPSGKDVIAWAKQVESLGAGEIMISSIDHDGMKKGFDINLIKMVTSQVNIPVIAASGAGSKEDILDVIIQAKPDAIALGSILHYNLSSIKEIKQFLSANGIKVKL